MIKCKNCGETNFECMEDRYQYYEVNENGDVIPTHSESGDSFMQVKCLNCDSLDDDTGFEWKLREKKLHPINTPGQS